MVLLSLDGVGDVASGSRVLLHEAIIGLVVGGEEVYIYTPDHGSAWGAKVCMGL